MIGHPELHEPRAGRADELTSTRGPTSTRSGSLLYELLAGVLPFDARSCASGLREIQRMIREKDPPRPSTQAEPPAGRAARRAAARRRTPRHSRSCAATSTGS